MGRLRETWNDPKRLSVLTPTWMLLWFLVCVIFIWPAFSLTLVAGVWVFVLAGQVPAMALMYRVRQIVMTARPSVTEPTQDG
jgi:hypothetical protein